MAGITHNANRVDQRLERMGPAMVREVTQELDKQSQLMARAMQREAPKARSTLATSIQVQTPEPMQRVISPGVDYAGWVHGGRAPGKGLPRFFDPAAKPMQDWLEQHMGGKPQGKRARASHELELRDRYQAMSWHMRIFGIKANPFAQRAFDQRVSETTAALKEAAIRGLRLSGVPA